MNPLYATVEQSINDEYIGFQHIVLTPDELVAWILWRVSHEPG